MEKIARSLRNHREPILNCLRPQKLLSSGVVLELALYHSLGKLPEAGIHRPLAPYPRRYAVRQRR